MKVNELIEKLKEYPQDKDVFFAYDIKDERDVVYAVAKQCLDVFSLGSVIISNKDKRFIQGNLTYGSACQL